ncbi:hypothetical protein HYG81_13495 [Natrinema zhouii]|uniref:Uncharacterized protein n=1 Tax=Natrinema zhouii TaxID=1710539 RepID=A0A7D6GUK3_9EURY|nr:hypothetical protein [Natrinema zhouii]QLK25106.1 hypothetical protein HYG81_13495 [Natrinema zhouii]
MGAGDVDGPTELERRLTHTLAGGHGRERHRREQVLRHRVDVGTEPAERAQRCELPTKGNRRHFLAVLGVPFPSPDAVGGKIASRDLVQVFDVCLGAPLRERLETGAVDGSG